MIPRGPNTLDNDLSGLAPRHPVRNHAVDLVVAYVEQRGGNSVKLHPGVAEHRREQTRAVCFADDRWCAQTGAPNRDELARRNAGLKRRGTDDGGDLWDTLEL